MLEEDPRDEADAPERTRGSFGLLWRETAEGRVAAPPSSHVRAAAGAVGLTLPVAATRILDAGCGPGADLGVLAAEHPRATVVGLDFNDAVEVAGRAVEDVANAHVVRGSVLAPPFARASFDLVHCYGVLHHTEAPARAFAELAALVAPGGRLLVYVYTDLREEPLLRAALRVVTTVRRATTRMPPRVVLRLARLGAPLVFLMFALPAAALRRLPGGAAVARRLPFNFIRRPAGAAGDLYDRFSAPIEHRHSQAEVLSWFTRARFEAVVVTQIPGARGWVGFGRRPDVRA